MEDDDDGEGQYLYLTAVIPSLSKLRPNLTFI